MNQLLNLKHMNRVLESIKENCELLFRVYYATGVTPNTLQLGKVLDESGRGWPCGERDSCLGNGRLLGSRERKNFFEALLDAAKYCSLGTMSHSLYDVGGEYRRNM